MNSNENMTNEVAELVRKAQGKRSLRTFAEIIGCNPSSLSRILSGRLIPRDETLIQAISSNAETPVTLDELRTAISREETARRNSSGARRGETERAYRDIINSALLNGGYSAVQIRDQSMPGNIDVAYLTNALSGTDAERWAFEFQIALPSGAAALILQRILFAAGRIYFGGMRCKRYSVVIADRDAFEQFKEENSGQMPVPDELSVVLIDLEHREVVDEYVMPTTGKAEPVCPFKTHDI